MAVKIRNKITEDLRIAFAKIATASGFFSFRSNRMQRLEIVSYAYSDTR